LDKDKSPSYIKALLLPNNHRPAGRKVWSIDLELVWIPFFSATNIMGDTAIPYDALGAPLRLAYNADGSVKFSKTGRPITKVAKELSDNIRMVRDNFTAGLVSYANGVINRKADEYRDLVELAKRAGEPILAKDKTSLEQALARQMEEAVAEATTAPAEREAVPA
jgi:hypothetical protein